MLFPQVLLLVLRVRDYDRHGARHLQLHPGILRDTGGEQDRSVLDAGEDRNSILTKLFCLSYSWMSQQLFG